MLPQEITKLQAVERRVPLHWAIAIVVTLLIAATPGAIYLITEDGGLDHLRGHSEAVVAEVESVQTTGSCSRSSRTRYEIELSWTLDGTRAGGTAGRCYKPPPQVGDTMTIWVGPGGTVSFNSPATDRLGLLVSVLVLGAVSTGLSVAIVHGQRKRRRGLLAAGNLGLSVATIVHVHDVHRGRLRLSATPPAPGRKVHGQNFVAIIYTQHGAASTTRRPRQVVGAWSLRLAPVVGNPRKRIGLLERGQERCWIYLTMPR